MEKLKRFLKEELKIYDDRIIKEFELFNDLILEWNSKINLISRKQESIEKNVLDSVFFLTKHPLKGDENIIDVGTGGGFPGIPLKILYPGLKVILLDSTLKKINSVKDIIEKMNLKGTEAVWGRADGKSKETKYRNKFDIVIALAVSSLDNIYKWCRGYLKKNGYIICLKGGNIGEETKRLDKYKNKIDYSIIEFSFIKYGNILQDKKLVIIKNKL